MSALLDFLSKLLPVWAALLVAGFAYLLVLLKRASDRFLEIADKQATYMKDRVDAVDKSTLIFTRTIEQQEKEIKGLRDNLQRLSADLQKTRETDARLSVQELRLLAESVNDLSTRQDRLLEVVSRSTSVQGRELLPQEPSIGERVQSTFERAIRARDLSIYPVLVADVPNSNELVVALRNAGYAASAYESEVDFGHAKDSAEAIWLGAMIPPANAVDVIRLARSFAPSLRYVHLSTDTGGPEETHYTLFLGGSTESAKGFLGCLPWSHADFERLDSLMSFDELHAAVRQHYRADATRNRNPIS